MLCVHVVMNNKRARKNKQEIDKYIHTISYSVIILQGSLRGVSFHHHGIIYSSNAQNIKRFEFQIVVGFIDQLKNEYLNTYVVSGKDTLLH